MKLEIGKSYSVLIPSEPAPDGEDFLLEVHKEFTVIEKDENEIIKQHFDHLLDSSWYYVNNNKTKKKYWYFLQYNHIINEIKTTEG